MNKAKKILKSIIDDLFLLRKNVEEYLLKKLPTDSEKLAEIDIERSKNRKKLSTILNKIKKICNKNTKCNFRSNFNKIKNINKGFINRIQN